MEVTYDVIKGSSDGKFYKSSVTRQLEPHEVYIETTHSGLCGTDEHYVCADKALGHEGVGIIKKVGDIVKSVKVGDRVGFGFTHQVCGWCDNCAQGWDQYCRNKKQYGLHDFDNGTFSSGAVWDEKCVYPIPEGYDSANAAPLMCAGATVWTVLSRYGVSSRDRVGVMGIGGLGHLAIKLAAAMGCHVVVLSSSETKRQEAMGYGASEFHVFQPGKEPSDPIKPVKHLLLCGTGATDYKNITPLLDTHGSIYPLAVALEPIPISMLDLVWRGARVQGSLVASRDTICSLIEFAARKNITPTVVTYPLTLEGVEKAMQDLRNGKVRYRAVLCRD